MTGWIGVVSDVMGCVNSYWDKAKHQVGKALGMQDPLRILPYRGYGTSNWIYLKGRVLQAEGIAPRAEDAGILKNLLNMYRRFETDEVPEAKVQICVGDRQQEIVANKEGSFEIELTTESPRSADSLWQTVNLKLLNPVPPKHSPVTATGKIITVSETAKFGVISDIDDTIVYTAANNLFKMIRIAYFGNEHSRRLFDGVASFYQSLQKGAGKGNGNPIFYVSSSAWNMYDLFDKFMELNDIPAGPILLRDIELSPENLLSFDHKSHKREQIDPVFRRFPTLPFMLIGDSGQKDAEIYSQIVQDYPDRILGIYIRDVLPENEERKQEIEAIAQTVRTAGVEFMLFSETASAAEHAKKQGWIAAD